MYDWLFAQSLPEKGDVSQDGFVNFADIAPFISILATEGYSYQADMDGSAVVDFLDISHFIARLSIG